VNGDEINLLMAVTEWNLKKMVDRLFMGRGFF